MTGSLERNGVLTLLEVDAKGLVIITVIIAENECLPIIYHVIVGTDLVTVLVNLKTKLAVLSLSVLVSPQLGHDKVSCFLEGNLAVNVKNTLNVYGAVRLYGNVVKTEAVKTCFVDIYIKCNLSAFGSLDSVVLTLVVFKHLYVLGALLYVIIGKIHGEYTLGLCRVLVGADVLIVSES